MLISVIVPVYNVENYLMECLDSILIQKFTDFEVILVDDGSSDRSGLICDEYSKRFHNIRAFHQGNKGLSAARNLGLRWATGDYILFIDSDDYIGENSFQALSKILNNDIQIDVMFLERINVYPDGRRSICYTDYKADQLNGKSYDEVMDYLAKMEKFPVSACVKIYRRTLIVNNKLAFIEGLLAEDIDWTVSILKYAKKYAYCSYPYYYYRHGREKSISNTKGEKHLECYIYIIRKWAKKDVDSPYQRAVNACMAYTYLMALSSLSQINKDLQKKYCFYLEEIKWIAKYGYSKKYKLISLCLKLLGVNKTCKLLNIFRAVCR